MSEGDTQQASADKIQRPVSTGGFDWKALSKDMTFAKVAETKEVQTRVAVSKPSKERFFRVHPSGEYELDLYLAEIKDHQELRGHYLPSPNLNDKLEEFLLEQQGIVRRKKLVLSTYVDGTIFVWPLNLPDGLRENSWNRSALEVASAAKNSWVRMTTGDGAYNYLIPESPLPEPDWPRETFEHWLEKAFLGRVINDFQHPVVRYLLGN